MVWTVLPIRLTQMQNSLLQLLVEMFTRTHIVMCPDPTLPRSGDYCVIMGCAKSTVLILDNLMKTGPMSSKQVNQCLFKIKTADSAQPRHHSIATRSFSS